MLLDKFLALLAALTGALGSVYVLRSSLAMSPGLTADLATPRWGFSTVIIDSLSDQRADSVVGASAFGVALVLGVGSILAPTIPLMSFARALIVSLVIAIVLLALMNWVRSSLAARHRAASRRQLLWNQLDATLKEGKFQKAWVEGLVSAARVLAGLELDVASGPRAVYGAVAKAARYTLPADLEIPVTTPEP